MVKENERKPLLNGGARCTTVAVEAKKLEGVTKDKWKETSRGRRIDMDDATCVSDLRDGDGVQPDSVSRHLRLHTAKTDSVSGFSH